MNKFLIALLLSAPNLTVDVAAQEKPKPRAVADAGVLDAEQWKQVDDSVQRGLKWLATEQQDNGSFRAIDSAQPAVTAFCLMAFLAKGESPADGQYSDRMAKAIDYIASQQKANGLIAVKAGEHSPIHRQRSPQNDITASVAIVYNHSISALALAEAYGQCDAEQAEKLNDVIEKAVAATIEMQNWKRKRKVDQGGWKYVFSEYGHDADLSSTCWQLMFLRSARNAGFEVPSKNIDLAVAFVERCFQEKQGVFTYTPTLGNSMSRAMAGAGIVALAHGAKHDTRMAQRSGDWLLTRDFTKYNANKSISGFSWQPDRYSYGVFHGTQAMYQLGGRHWTKFFPPVVETLLANQEQDGSWPVEPYDQQFGNCYSTSLCVLALSVPNQILPIFQR